MYTHTVSKAPLGLQQKHIRTKLIKCMDKWMNKWLDALTQIFNLALLIFLYGYLNILTQLILKNRGSQLCRNFGLGISKVRIDISSCLTLLGTSAKWFRNSSLLLLDKIRSFVKFQFTAKRSSYNGHKLCLSVPGYFGAIKYILWITSGLTLGY